MQPSSTTPIAINYIEFNVHDLARSKAFYTQLGWTFTDYGEQYCEFDSGQLNGGFCLSDKIKATGGALIILYSHNLHDSYQRIQAAGAIITQEIFEFPGGQRFHFKDLDGYELAIWSDQI